MPLRSDKKSSSSSSAKGGGKRKREEPVAVEVEEYSEQNSDDAEEDDEYDEDQEEDENREMECSYESDGSEGSRETDDDSEAGLRPADKIAIGLDVAQMGSIEELQATMMESELNFACIPIFNSGGVLEELSLDNGDLTSVVVGKVTDLSAFNSIVAAPQALSNTFYEQFSFAAHLGLQAVILSLDPEKHSGHVVSRILTNTLLKFPPTAPQIWLRLTPDMWGYWDILRHQLDHNPRVFIALDLSQETDATLLKISLDKWGAEPTKAVFLSTTNHFTAPSLKTSNKRINPPAEDMSEPEIVIDKSGVQRVCQFFFRFPTHFILLPSVSPSSAVASVPNKEVSKSINNSSAAKKRKMESSSKGESNHHSIPWVHYGAALHILRSDWLNTPLSSDPAEAEALQLEAEFNFSFRDKLQTPLDPLQVSLDLETYRVMEEDPVKYARYEEALVSAMIEIRTKRQKEKQQITNGQKGGKGKGDSEQRSVIRVLVVGPGRGFLIEASHLAGGVTQQDVQVVAIEKNANAVRTLRHRFQQRFSKEQVTVLQGDMRDLVPRYQDSLLALGSIDIVVSELLGSFADNEASPECLYAIERVLNPHTGVMVPQSYLSYLQPISGSHLWQQARNMFAGSTSNGSADKNGLDYPYVVQLHATHSLGGRAQPAFEVATNHYSLIFVY